MMDHAAINAGFDLRRYAMKPTHEAEKHHGPCRGFGDCAGSDDYA